MHFKYVCVCAQTHTHLQVPIYVRAFQTVEGEMHCPHSGYKLNFWVSATSTGGRGLALWANNNGVCSLAFQ